MKIAVIIPTINEALNIRELIPAIDRELKEDYTIVIIDDNSSDCTQNVAEYMAQYYPVKLVSRPGKMGLASAVIDGMVAAPMVDAYIVMDADFSHPPDVLPYLRDNLEKYDIVVASRYIPGGHTSGWPIHRRIVSKVASKMANFQLTAVKDPLSGYFGVRTSLLYLSGQVPIHIPDLSPIGFKILLEILVKARHYSWVEIPYTFVERKHGKSKLKAGICFDYLRHLKSLYQYMYQTMFYEAKLGAVKTK